MRSTARLRLGALALAGLLFGPLSAVASDAPVVGTAAPDFRLQDQNGSG